jgi:hypothetical protein
MKYLLPFIAGALFTTDVLSQQVAAGVSVQGGRTVFASIDLSETLRIEPSIYYSKDRSSGDSPNKYEYIELLTGFFKLKNYSEKSKLFYGARAGYSAYHHRGYSGSEHFEGYKIAPTMGLEYLLVENITLSGEVSFNYSNENGNAETRESTNTDTELSVRYYF